MTTDEATRSKIRLAAELLESLRLDRMGRAPSEMRRKELELEDIETAETVAQNYQRRDNRRFSHPVLRVLIGQETYSTLDWSLGGVGIANYLGDLRVHARFKLALSDGSKDAVYFAAEGRAARADKPNRLLTIQFTTLSKGGFDWLSDLQLMQLKAGRHQRSR